MRELVAATMTKVDNHEAGTLIRLMPSFTSTRLIWSCNWSPPKSGKALAGVKFWVYNANAEVSATEAKTQRLTLKFTPVSATTGKPLQTAANAGK